jgi:cobalamin biosynthesis Mg chelatase CobN
MESQAFYAMGVKPRWDEAGRIAGIEVLPASALKRPRMDVLVSVTGSYRDQFPNVMRWLDEAVQQVAALDEPGNAVAQHSAALARKLRAEGATPAEAKRWSTARVFSNEQGSYGAGLEEAALASDVWTSQRRGGGDAQMARLYMDRMGHAYGQGLDGAARPGAYAGNLAQVDAALMARTSNLYGVLTNDDPFQYLGGIAQAVRQLTGKDPALYVQNLRDGGAVRTDTAAGAIAREMQTRYLHPQWIEAQKAEGYSGTLQVLKTAQFLWGWQVTAPGTVRQDQWQSLHDVYVRDRYKLGTREWLEGDNRAAFAQTLERMLDAVRLELLGARCRDAARAGEGLRRGRSRDGPARTQYGGAALRAGGTGAAGYRARGSAGSAGGRAPWQHRSPRLRPHRHPTRPPPRKTAAPSPWPASSSNPRPTRHRRRRPRPWCSASGSRSARRCSSRSAPSRSGGAAGRGTRLPSLPDSRE